MRHLEGKSEIAYPCNWEYRVIGEDEKRVEIVVSEIVKKPYTLEIKNRKGRFVSLHLVVGVDDEGERNEIYRLLSTHQEVRMVL